MPFRGLSPPFPHLTIAPPLPHADGLCQWFLTDGVTPDTTDAQVNITDCNSCQKQCLESGECIYWSFNGSETRNYRAGCGSGGFTWVGHQRAWIFNHLRCERRATVMEAGGS